MVDQLGLTARNSPALFAGIGQFLSRLSHMLCLAFRVLSVAAFIHLLLGAGVRCQCTASLPLSSLEDPPLKKAHDAEELGAMCDKSQLESDASACRKVVDELERTLDRESCPHGRSPACEVVRSAVWALAQCASRTSEIPPGLFRALKRPAYAGVRWEAENALSKALIDLMAKASQKKTGATQTKAKSDYVRRVIDEFKGDPEYIAEIPIIFARALERSLDGETGKGISAPDLIDVVTDEKWYPERQHSRPLLENVRLGLTSAIASRLRSNKTSGKASQVVGVDRPGDKDKVDKDKVDKDKVDKDKVDKDKVDKDKVDKDKVDKDKVDKEKSVPTPSVISRLLERRECRLRLIEALLARVEPPKAKDNVSEERKLLAKLLTKDHSGATAFVWEEMDEGVRCGFATLILRGGEPKTILAEIQASVPSSGERFEIVRRATAQALSEGDATKLQALWNWAPTSEQPSATQGADEQRLVRHAMQRGFADTLLHGELDDAKKELALLCLKNENDKKERPYLQIALAEGTGREDLFTALVRILRTGVPVLRRTALAVIHGLQVEGKLPTHADFQHGLNRQLLIALVLSNSDPELASTKEARRFCSDVLKRIRELKEAPSLLPEDNWRLTDVLLETWTARDARHRTRVGWIPWGSLTVLPADLVDADCPGWLRLLHPEAAKRQVTLEEWRRWWGENKYILF